MVSRTQSRNKSYPRGDIAPFEPRRHTLHKIEIPHRKARKYIQYIMDMKLEEDNYNGMDMRDYVWKKKKEFLRGKILPIYYINAAEENLLFKLPLWIAKDKAKRREWTKKISMDLERMPNLMDRRGSKWTPGPKDTEIKKFKNLEMDLKKEPMNEKRNILIIDLEDLEPPTQKTGGTKGPLKINNLTKRREKFLILKRAPPSQTKPPD
jgi:hypothetical protein